MDVSKRAFHFQLKSLVDDYEMLPLMIARTNFSLILARWEYLLQRLPVIEGAALAARLSWWRSERDLRTLVAGVATGVVAVGAGLFLQFSSQALTFLQLENLPWRGCFHRARHHKPLPRQYSLQRPAWSACSVSQILHDPFPLQNTSPLYKEASIPNLNIVKLTP